MNVYGYRILEKFPNLFVTAEHRPSAPSMKLDPSAFADASGLLLCHTSESELKRLYSHDDVRLRIDRGTLVVVGLNTVLLHVNDISSPFFHCVNYGIPTPCRNSAIMERFQRLVSRARSCDAPPGPDTIQAEWWSVIDQPQIPEAVRKRIDDIRLVIRAGPATGNNVKQKFREIVLKYYDHDHFPTFSQLSTDFEQWQKLPISRWQERRANLNHNVFQHEFYQLLAGEVRQPVDHVLVNVILGAWPNIKKQFVALFEDAVPFAVVDPRLSIAQATPASAVSAATIDEFRQCYGATIKLQIDDSKKLLDAVDKQVTTVHESPADKQSLECLVAACRAFTDRVADLEALSTLARGN